MQLLEGLRFASLGTFYSLGPKRGPIIPITCSATQARESRSDQEKDSTHLPAIESPHRMM